MTAAGVIQLSYWPARTKIDQQQPQGEDEVGGAADELLLVGHGGPLVVQPGRRVFAAIRSIACIALAGAEAAAAAPLIVADGKRL